VRPDSDRWSPAEFARFYRRHEREVAGVLIRRTGRADLAADLTSEVFAAALLAWRRAGNLADVTDNESAWLFGIVRNKLVDSYRRGRVEDEARRQLGMRATELTDESLSAIEALTSDTPALELVGELPPEQRFAVTAHVIEGRSYKDIAQELALSEQVVRKRVSRGLARMRDAIGDQR
jgi:RNA polymerase sigma factor (sigma-70 family)